MERTAPRKDMSSSSGRKRLLSVMAGFFSGSHVPESTQIWIRAVQAISHRVVLVFDNPEPHNYPDSWRGERCAVLFKPHSEYDFGSYKRGLQWAEEKGWLKFSSHILFFNDSVYGPISDLNLSIMPMLQRDDEAWGLTASNQITPHLQSFFLLLGITTLCKPRVRKIFDSVQRQPSRQAVIENYELGLSKALLAEKISLKALLPSMPHHDNNSYEQIINPTSWPLTAVKLGLPVLKKKAFLDEFANQEGFAETCRMVAKRNPELWKAILAESPHWKLWGEHLKLGIFWENHVLEHLPEKLDLLRKHLTCEWSIILSTDIKNRHLISKNFDEAINNNELTLVNSSDETGDVLEMLLNSDHDWIVVVSQATWAQPHRWALLQRQLIQQPDRDVLPGDPVAVRRHWWLKQGGDMKNVIGYQYEPIQISPISSS